MRGKVEGEGIISRRRRTHAPLLRACGLCSDRGSQGKVQAEYWNGVLSQDSYDDERVGSAVILRALQSPDVSTTRLFSRGRAEKEERRRVRTESIRDS